MIDVDKNSLVKRCHSYKNENQDVRVGSDVRVLYFKYQAEVQNQQARTKSRNKHGHR